MFIVHWHTWCCCPLRFFRFSLNIHNIWTFSLSIVPNLYHYLQGISLYIVDGRANFYYFSRLWNSKLFMIIDDGQSVSLLTVYQLRLVDDTTSEVCKSTTLYYSCQKTVEWWGYLSPHHRHTHASFFAIVEGGLPLL